MKRGAVLAVCFCLLAGLFLWSTPARAAEPPPAETAETIRAALFAAQVSLAAPGGEAAAAEQMEVARTAYGGKFAAQLRTAAPEADARIFEGLDEAERAITPGGRVADYAAARAKVWTAILAGAGARLEQAVADGDVSAARQWLAVREYRPTTRFSRPATGATLALDAWAEKQLSTDETLLALRAELLDVYQARLTESLHDLATVDRQGFSVRRAELAGLVEGYFAILAPAYADQRGASAQAEALSAFSALREAALEEDGGTAQAMEKAEAALTGFRAAPLTPEEQARRAGQLLRYLSLVPVEYARGVDRGQLVHDFEVQEAVTFRNGAYAAFTDLESLLVERDAALVSQARQAFARLEEQLSQAAESAPGSAVPPTGEVKAGAEALAESLKTVMPAEWLQNNTAGDFEVIALMLDQMEAAVIGKDYLAAESARLEAYAVMEVGPEARLMAFAPQLRVEIEDLFWNGQAPTPGLAGLIKAEAPQAEIHTSRLRLDAALEQAQTTLQASNAPGAVAFNAGMIMFREGLEAVIILASLMSSMKRAEERKYRKPMWLGAMGAVAATVLTWLLAHDVLQSLARYGEKLEAVVSLIAIGVLLVIMNWFFHKVYWTEWIAGFHARKRRIISGEAGLWLGLVTLGFTSVYREGFETVLFLQALVLETGAGVVLAGAAAALAAVCLIGFVTFRLQVNLPYKRMLIVTGVLIGIVLLQMVGNTVHILQVVGWLPIHAVGGQPLPYWVGSWFGVYATWEGLGMQFLAGVFVIGSYYLAEGMKREKREHNGKQRIAASKQRIT